MLRRRDLTYTDLNLPVFDLSRLRSTARPAYRGFRLDDTDDLGDEQDAHELEDD